MKELSNGEVFLIAYLKAVAHLSYLGQDFILKLGSKSRQSKMNTQQFKRKHACAPSLYYSTLLFNAIGMNFVYFWHLADIIKSCFLLFMCFLPVAPKTRQEKLRNT